MAPHLKIFEISIEYSKRVENKGHTNIGIYEYIVDSIFFYRSMSITIINIFSLLLQTLEKFCQYTLYVHSIICDKYHVSFIIY